MNKDNLLPISVIIPTLNSISEIVGHIQSLNKWIAQVSEVIVVDSESSDGTMEHMQQHLKHPNAKFINHPPGLYQSWNAAIKEAKSKYVYIATVSDEIPFSTLQKLYEVAESHDADVVLSPPTLVAPSGEIHNKKWPLHYFIESRGLTEPYRLSHWERLVYNTVDLPSTLIGSSASNLYKTKTLQDTPFPVDCGVTGDSAWAMQQSLTGNWIIVPNLPSKFIFLSNRNLPDKTRTAMRLACYQQSAKTWEEFLQQENNNEKYSGVPILISELQKCLEKKYLVSSQLRRCKKQILPWYLSPKGWLLRRQEKAIKAELDRIKRELSAY